MEPMIGRVVTSSYKAKRVCWIWIFLPSRSRLGSITFVILQKPEVREDCRLGPMCVDCFPGSASLTTGVPTNAWRKAIRNHIEHTAQAFPSVVSAFIPNFDLKDEEEQNRLVRQKFNDLSHTARLERLNALDAKLFDVIACELQGASVYSKPPVTDLYEFLRGFATSLPLKKNAQKDEDFFTNMPNSKFKDVSPCRNAELRHVLAQLAFFSRPSAAESVPLLTDNIVKARRLPQVEALRAILASAPTMSLVPSESVIPTSGASNQPEAHLDYDDGGFFNDVPSMDAEQTVDLYKDPAAASNTMDSDDVAEEAIASNIPAVLASDSKFFDAATRILEELDYGGSGQHLHDIS